MVIIVGTVVLCLALAGAFVHVELAHWRFRRACSVIIGEKPKPEPKA